MELSRQESHSSAGKDQGAEQAQESQAVDCWNLRGVSDDEVQCFLRLFGLARGTFCTATQGTHIHTTQTVTEQQYFLPHATHASI